MASGPMIDVADLPEVVRSGEMPNPPQSFQAKSNELAQSRRQAEFNRVIEALRRQQNNRRRAAKELGVSRVTLYKKLRQYDLM
jgi:transcriptional regulator with PAS, ATPase and Fis domain